MEGQFWSLVIVAAPILLGAALAYVLIKRRRLSPNEKRAQDAGTRKQYRDESE